MQWSSFVRDITANDLPHISVKTVEYRSCTNLFSSSVPISVLQKATRHKVDACNNVKHWVKLCFQEINRDSCN